MYRVEVTVEESRRMECAVQEVLPCVDDEAVINRTASDLDNGERQGTYNAK